jgi:hypothetical protein
MNQVHQLLLTQSSLIKMTEDNIRVSSSIKYWSTSYHILKYPTGIFSERKSHLIQINFVNSIAVPKLTLKF